MISIITVNFNNKAGLEETIKSVACQSGNGVEYLVIDGGSTDGSVEVLKENEAHITYWISERDKGIYHAMNKGIAKATGDYLMFLNSGDCLIDTTIIHKSQDFINQVPDADVYYGDMYIVNDVNNPFLNHWKHPEKLSLSFLKGQTINHQASLIKATLFKEFGLYPEHYKLASDYWLWLKCLLNNKKFKHFGFPMVNYDVSGSSSTDKELYKSEKHSIWKSLVPECVQEIVTENEHYKQLMKYAIIKAAIGLNNKYQAFRKGK